jgi:hypothetical protein
LRLVWYKIVVGTEPSPGYAALEDEYNAGKVCPVVDAVPTALGLGHFFGQQRKDYFPKFVCDESLAIPSHYPLPSFVRCT